MRKKLIIYFICLIALSCTNNNRTGQVQETFKPVLESKVVHPEWAKDAVIYEVNIRQYTPEGTFEAFGNHLPRLKELGVEVLWFMPIFPIGNENRKGELGSYYSIKDYKAVNPEFGTMDDFKSLVNKAHELGFKVIIDWVANHTSWDNEWMDQHPEWYKKDSLGNFYGPFDWTDVAQLNYDNEELHDAMISALKFWATEANIDGYRCDVAGMVPVGFWNKARKALDVIKPVFMLAEDEENHLLLEKAFDMNYGWEFHHIMNKIAKGEAGMTDIRKFFAKEDSIYPKNCYRMQFITNHDENSWNGTEFERLGDAVRTFAALTFTVPGMPLVYTGQEVGLNKRLAFFTKDEVEYTDNGFQDFYKALIELKKANKVFWNGEEGGDMEIIGTTDNQLFVFRRFNKTDEVVLIFNLSPENGELIIPKKIKGKYTDYLKGENVTLKKGEKLNLSPWDYKILIKRR